MRENLIEKDGVKYAEDRDWFVIKLASPGRPGAHDRLHFKKCVCFTIEYKATGEHATPKQLEFAKKLKMKSIPCRCCDSVQKARDFIDEMTRVADEKDPIYDMMMLSNDMSSFEE